MATLGGAKDMSRVKKLVREVEGLPADVPPPPTRAFPCLCRKFALIVGRDGHQGRTERSSQFSLRHYLQISFLRPSAHASSRSESQLRSHRLSRRSFPTSPSLPVHPTLYLPTARCRTYSPTSATATASCHARTITTTLSQTQETAISNRSIPSFRPTFFSCYTRCKRTEVDQRSRSSVCETCQVIDGIVADDESEGRVYCG